MPELPEVETIRRQLEKAVVGRRIGAVQVRFGGRLRPGPEEFARRVSGKHIISAGRRAKLLLIGLDDSAARNPAKAGDTMVIHLKMTGRLLLVRSDAPVTKHTHIIFPLDGGEDLRFEDIRKFGFLRLYRTADLDRELFDKEGYGPEPLDPSFTARRFILCARGRGPKRIKPLLMDQTCIAGIGNIYADEGLWRARIRPERRTDTLTDADLGRLRLGVVAAMRDSLRRRGTSADNYVDLYGSRGENVPRLKVYGREGEPCRRCGTPIRKIRFAGRGTHFCPKCQG